MIRHPPLLPTLVAALWCTAAGAVDPVELALARFGLDRDGRRLAAALLQVTREQPASAPARRLLAEIYVEQERWPEAVEQQAQYLGLLPEGARASAEAELRQLRSIASASTLPARRAAQYALLVGKARRLLEIGAAGAAHTVAGRAAAVDPSGWEAWSLRGGAALTAGDGLGAVEALSTAFERSDGAARSHLVAPLAAALRLNRHWLAMARGARAHREGDLAGAAMAYEEAFDLDVDRAEAGLAATFEWLLAGQPRRAADHLDALRIQVDGRGVEGERLAAASELVAARIDAVEAAARGRVVASLRGAADARGRRDHAAEARFLRSALQGVPGHVVAAKALVRVLADSGDLEGALVAASTLATHAPDAAHLWRGRCLLRLSRAKEAVSALGEATLSGSASPAAWRALAAARRAAGDLPGAVQAAGRAIELEPDEWSSHAGLGGALADSKRWEDAAAAYRQAAALAGWNPGLHVESAAALFATGRREEARLATVRAGRLGDPDRRLLAATEDLP